MIDRRSFIKLVTSLPILSVISIPSFADVKSAMRDSSLIYLTPIKSDGQESSCQAEATVVIDKSVEEKALQLLGDKYSMEWIVWGPRFRKGLADGSRVMLRYRPLTV